MKRQKRCRQRHRSSKRHIRESIPIFGKIQQSETPNGNRQEPATQQNMNDHFNSNHHQRNNISLDPPLAHLDIPIASNGNNLDSFEDISCIGLTENNEGLLLQSQDIVGETETNVSADASLASTNQSDFPILDLPIDSLASQSDIAVAGNSTAMDDVMVPNIPEKTVFVDPHVGDPRSESLLEHEIILLKLMKLCKDAQVPAYFLDEMLCILRNEDSSSIDINHLKVMLDKYRNGAQFLRRLNEIFPAPRPMKTLVGLEGFCEHSVTDYRGGNLSSAQLMHWNPKDVLMYILGIDNVFKEVGNITNISNNDDPFIQTGGDPSNNTELLHGSWARAYIESKRETWVDGLDLLCPVVIYIDETHVTSNGRVKVTPVLMACGLLNKNVRYLQENIKPLAYIPRHDTDSSAMKDRSDKGVGRAVRNFHKLMSVVTRSLEDMKKELLKTRTIIRIGNMHRRMRLHCPVAFFVGDAKQQDIVAGRYGVSNCQRISRWCDASKSQAGIPGHRCKEWLVSETKPIVLELNRWREMGRQEMSLLDDDPNEQKRIKNERIQHLKGKLQSISAHRVVNSLWENVDDDNTLLPLPHDMMHIFTTICKILFELTVHCLSKLERAVLDKLVNNLLGKHRSSKTQRFPRLTFTGGFCSITELTSGEWVGKLFCLMILAHLPIGKEKMKDCFERKGARTRKAQEKEEIPPTNPVNSNEVIDLFEDLLLFHAYYSIGWPYDRNTRAPDEKSIFHWNKRKETTLRGFIEKLQRKITKRFPREKGSGWKFQKFHEIIHLPKCISLYGMPDNYNADWGERALKQYGKKPGKLVRKKMNDEMLEKIADRIVDMDVVDKAYSVCVNQDDQVSFVLAESDDTEASDAMPTIEYSHEKNSKYTLAVSNGCLRHKEWHREGRLKVSPTIPELITNYFVKTYGTSDEVVFIHGYTEFKIHRKGVADDMIFRCHPSFRSGPPWYDWCLVNLGRNATGSSYPRNDTFRGSGRTKLDQVPSKMLAIFQVQRKEGGMGPTRILIQRCRGSDHKYDSMITETWMKASTIEDRHIPSMDEERNILPDGQGTPIQVRYPKLEEIDPASIELPLFVVEEDPAVRVYSEVGNTEHSDHILVVKDRIEHWSLNFDSNLTKTNYNTNN